MKSPNLSQTGAFSEKKSIGLLLEHLGFPVCVFFLEAWTTTTAAKLPAVSVVVATMYSLAHGMFMVLRNTTKSLLFI